MSHGQPGFQHPPGPQEAFPVNVDAPTLAYLREGCARYGDVWVTPPVGTADNAASDGGLPVWVLNEPEAIHEVLTKRQGDFAKGIGFERVKMLLGDGLIVSDGEHWKQRRRMLQPAFARPKVDAMGGMVQTCLDKREAVWEQHARDGTAIDLTEEANRLGLRIILRAIFGADLDGLDAREGGNPFDLLVDVHERDLMFAMRFRQIWKVVKEVVLERRNRDQGGQPPADFLGHYMSASDRESGAALDMEGLVDEVMTLVVAGHETSAATIAWAWDLLARHPEVQRSLGEGEDPQDLALKVVHETLRLYPPVWMFTRRALVDGEIAGFPMPAGSQVLIAPFLLHRHPAHWQNPEHFDPARFPTSGLAPVRGAYIPFSSGPRRCAGDHFALRVVSQQILHVAGRYRLSPLDPEPPALDPAVNLRSKDPIRLRVSAK